MRLFKTMRKRGLALFLVLMMCISLLPTTALAAVTSNGGFEIKGVTTNTPAADTKTSDNYNTLTQPGNEGMVWTDKSVTSSGEDSFDVTFSAMSSAKQEITTNSEAVDVMLVLDVSDSMISMDGTAKTRLQRMGEAADKFVQQLLAPGHNPNTRIGVTTFSYYAKVILPLDNYQTAKIQATAGQVTASGSGGSLGPQSGAHTREVGTNIQAGMNIAIEHMQLNPKPSNKPYVILLSDGQPAHANNSVVSVSGSTATLRDSSENNWMWGNNRGALQNGGAWNGTTPGATVSDSDVISLMKALLTAAGRKEQLRGNYPGKDVTVYTIGLALNAITNGNLPTHGEFEGRVGPTQIEMAQVMLNPGAYLSDGIVDNLNSITNNAAYRIQCAWNSYKRAYNADGTKTSGWEDRNVVLSVPAGGNHRNHQLNYVIESPRTFNAAWTNISSLNYVDGAYFVEDTSALEATFKSIIQSMETPATPAIQASGGNSGLIFTDPIGDGMVFDSLTGVTYNGKPLTVSGNAAVGYTLSSSEQLYSGVSKDAVDLSKIQIKVEGNTVTVEVAPDALPTFVNKYTDSKWTGSAGCASPLTVTYKVKKAASTAADTAAYSNAFDQGTKEAGAKVEFTPAEGNRYYVNSENSNVTVPKTDNDSNTAPYISKTTLADGKVTVLLGNNGRLGSHTTYTANISFKKTDAEGAALSGAEFQLNGGTYTQTATSGTNGMVTFTEIPLGGTYTLKETKAPDGFAKSNMVYTFKVDDKGNDSKVYKVEGETQTEFAGMTVVNYKPALSIEKSADPTSGVKFGENITYTITVKNTGDVDLTGVVVDDDMKGKATPVEGDEIGWNIGDLAVNQDKKISYTYKVTLADVEAGEVENTATVKGTGPSGSEPTATSEKVVVKTQGEPELTITKSTKDETVVVGDKITYTITVTNGGTAKAENVVITDALDTKLVKLVSAKLKLNGKDVNVENYTGTDGKNTITVGELDKGKSATLEIVVEAIAVGTVTNNASVKGDDVPDVSPEKPVSTEITGKPTLTIKKETTDTKVQVNEDITYTITVTNNGSAKAENVVITDTLDLNLVKLVSAKLKANGAEEFTNVTSYTGTDNQNTITVGDLDENKSAVLEIVVKALKAGEVTNTASVAGKDIPTVPPTDSVTTTVTGTPDLKISKTTDDTAVKVGDTITYKITVKNEGTDKATGVTITDTLDITRVKLVSAKLKLNGKDVNVENYTGTDGKNTVTVGELDVNESAELVIVVKAIAVGNVQNSASVTGNEIPNGLPTLPVTTEISGKPALSITKATNDTNVKVGDPITYTITVANAAEATADATNVTVSDRLDPRLTFTGVAVDGSSVPYSVDPATKTVSVSIVDALVPGATKTVVITAVATEAGTVLNTAAVDSTETEPTNSNQVQTVVEASVKQITYIWIDSLNGHTIGDSRVVPVDTTIPPTEYPAAPNHTDEGYQFKNWSNPVEVTDGVFTITAYYEPIPQPGQINVTWVDGHNGDILKQEQHSVGTTTIPSDAYPDIPAHAGYTFEQWTLKILDNGDIIITANYRTLVVNSDGPTFEELKNLDITVEVVCDTNATHSPETHSYSLMEGSYETTSVVNGSCTLTIYNDLYVEAYGGDHSLVGYPAQTIVLEYVTDAPDTPNNDAGVDNQLDNIALDDFSDNQNTDANGSGDFTDNGVNVIPDQTMSFAAVGYADSVATGHWKIAEGYTAKVTFHVRCENPIIIPVDHTLTVHYVYVSGGTAQPSYNGVYAENASYSVDSPSIPGYTASQAVVSGTMGTADLVFTVVYTPNAVVNHNHTLTVHYVYANGNTAQPSYTGVYAENANYSVASPAISGYTASQAVVSGTMGTANLEFTVVYTPDAAVNHTLTVHYVYADGNMARADHIETLAEGDGYNVASPAISGYTASQAVVSGTMGTADLVFTVVYTPDAAVNHTLTINYVYANGGTAQPSYTGVYAENAGYSVASPTISGYTASQAVVSGTMGTTDLVFTVYYSWNGYIPAPTPTPVPTPTPTPTPTPAPGGTTTIPDTNPPLADGTTIDDPDVPLAGAVGLNDVDHFAYIIGYEDDTVRPLNNITRAEVATIFFRLMTDEFRSANWATTNDFSDVTESNWFNNAISTCAKAGALSGYTDGSFKPNASITRAEFAAIAARFLSDEYVDDGKGDFSDTADHWAAKEIRLAAKAGWIQGDGNKFRPNDKITRAEVMTIVNRMLDRVPDADHMLDTMKKWIDNPEDAWYYEAVQEATNEHAYERDADLGVVETWTEILAVRDWAALEKGWADANAK